MPAHPDHFDRFSQLCAILFSPESHHGELRTAAHDLFELLAGIIGLDDKRPGEVAAMDSFLDGAASGKAISLQGAARCLWEYRRSQKFLLGVEAALRRAQAQFPGQRLRLMEAGCGPFALLALPLALRFTPEEVGFVLVDIHEHSLKAARQLVQALGLEAWVEAYVEADLTTWQCPAALRPHVAVSETMQNGLKNEPQVFITRNLAPQVQVGGYFLPQCIALDFGWLGSSNTGSGPSFTPVCTFFELRPETPDTPESGLIQFSTPQPETGRPAIGTRITVFDDISLDLNECSLNLPIPLKKLPRLEAGDQLNYHYRHQPLPRWEFGLEKQAE